MQETRAMICWTAYFLPLAVYLGFVLRGLWDRRYKGNKYWRDRYNTTPTHTYGGEHDDAIAFFESDDD